MTDWREDASCRGMGWEMFFPERGERAPAAVAVCKTCPVSEECLSFARTQEHLHGIWGGLNERERNRLPRLDRWQPLRPFCGTEAAYNRHIRRGEPTCADCRKANALKSARSRERSA